MEDTDPVVLHTEALGADLREDRLDALTNRSDARVDLDLALGGDLGTRVIERADPGLEGILTFLQDR